MQVKSWRKCQASLTLFYQPNMNIDTVLVMYVFYNQERLFLLN